MHDPTPDLAAWLAYLFDHPVGQAPWQRDPMYDGLALRPEDEARLLIEMFEGAAAAFAPYSDAQLNAGLWYCLSPIVSGHTEFLRETELPAALKQRVLASFVSVFETTMATRCEGLLEFVGECEDEAARGKLDGICFMWWEALDLPCLGEGAEFRAFLDSQLDVLERILAMPHDACRASALHGLGHLIEAWSDGQPDFTAELARAEGIIDAFLQREERSLREELADYARQARTGRIL